MAERDFIRWIREQTRQHADVIIPPGDDCGGLRWADSQSLLVTTDMLLEGSCFLRDAGPERIGRKAMSVNLSDMAAMAAIPIAAVVSVGFPHDISEEWAKACFTALQQQATRFNTIILGGDTNAWDGPICINVTFLGRPTDRGAVRRSGAKPGDALLVTGELGGSILGHHLDFTPRVAEAQLLQSLVDLHAMIDLSDGLATDVHHLCNESGCGVEIWADQLPVREAVHHLHDGKTPVEHALSDGEDFELLFACSESDAAKLMETQPLKHLGVNLSHIGRFLSVRAVQLKIDGMYYPLASTGYEHQFGQHVR
ncbi:MAG: thiamine-monophosphate kinase [Planctomycetia bacterium]|nr:thiamine-monophosphate kinase [Planctomycetia bacterium]